MLTMLMVTVMEMLEILLGISKETPEVIIEFRDRGIPFNPLLKDDPDTTLSAEERKIGGLGIFMVKKKYG